MGCDDRAASLLAGRARLAVPINGENASPRHAKTVFAAAEKLGEITVRRIYGDYSNGRLAAWNDAVRAFAFVACHQPAHVKGKNTADIALGVDAMDLMHSHRPAGFVPVSSDSDFTRLAQRAPGRRFRGLRLRRSKTPRAFRAACHRFEIVGNGAGKRLGRWVQERER